MSHMSSMLNEEPIIWTVRWQTNRQQLEIPSSYPRYLWTIDRQKFKLDISILQ